MEKTLKIFGIKHEDLRDEQLVVADSLDEAIDKFRQNYIDDYRISQNGIESVELRHKLEVIV